MLTPAEQREALQAAALNAGVEIDIGEISWRDEFITVDGLKIHYLDWGGAGKPPLLLIHGGMQTAHTWDLIAAVMSRRFHVAAIDLRGHGDSDWSPDHDYTLAAYRRDLSGLVEHMGWDKLILAGVSLGGLAALDYAAHDWERLAAFVIIDAGPKLKPSGVGRILEFGRGSTEPSTMEEFIDRAIAHNPRRRREQLRYSLTHALRQLEDGTWTWKYDRKIARSPLWKEQNIPTIRFDVLWDDLRAIRCPTLVVRGGESDVFAEETAHEMIEALPDGTLVTVPGAGHLVPQDSPAGFLEAVAPFIDELDFA